MHIVLYRHWYVLGISSNNLLQRNWHRYLQITINTAFDSSFFFHDRHFFFFLDILSEKINSYGTLIMFTVCCEIEWKPNRHIHLRYLQNEAVATRRKFLFQFHWHTWNKSEKNKWERRVRLQLCWIIAISQTIIENWTIVYGADMLTIGIQDIFSSLKQIASEKAFVNAKISNASNLIATSYECLRWMFGALILRQYQSYPNLH